MKRKAKDKPGITPSRRLLLADDDPLTLETLSVIFADAGYAFATAGSLQEALAAVERETFAFILADQFGGVRDGLRPVGTLRDAALPTPVGLTSAWPLTPEEVADTGFACYIPKPFSVDDLLSAVAACIRSHPTAERERDGGR